MELNVVERIRLERIGLERTEMIWSGNKWKGKVCFGNDLNRNN